MNEKIKDWYARAFAADPLAAEDAAEMPEETFAELKESLKVSWIFKIDTLVRERIYLELLARA